MKGARHVYYPMSPRSTVVHSSCLDLGYGNVSVTLECNGVRCHQTTRCKDMANYPDDRTRPSPKSVFGTEFLRVCCNIGAGSYFFSCVAGGVLGRVWHKNHALPN